MLKTMLLGLSLLVLLALVFLHKPIRDYFFHETAPAAEIWHVELPKSHLEPSSKTADKSIFSAGYDGQKIFIQNALTKEITEVARRLKSPTEEQVRPEEIYENNLWSDVNLKGADDIQSLDISSTGKYLAVTTSGYESCSTVIFNLQERTSYRPQDARGSLADVDCGKLEWSRQGDRFVIASEADAFSETGLFVSRPGNSPVVDTISREKVISAHFSSDGLRIVFVEINYTGEKVALKIFNLKDESLQTIKSRSPWYSWHIADAIFSLDDKELFFVTNDRDANRNKLFRIRMNDGMEEQVADYPMNCVQPSWSREGLFQLKCDASMAVLDLKRRVVVSYH